MRRISLLRLPFEASRRACIVALLTALVVAACASTTARTPPVVQMQPAPADVIAPNEHLRAENIPPVPKALAERVGKYNEFKPANLIACFKNLSAIVIN